MKKMAMLALLALTSLTLADPRILWSRDTDWGKVMVGQEGEDRLLLFKSAAGETEESRMSLKAPLVPTLHYVRQMMALTAVWEANRGQSPEPPRFLVVGLGGASLSNALADVFRQAHVVSVEIEPAVVEAARRYFFYKESERVETVLDDARNFLEHNHAPFDVIYLDAFDGTGVPVSLRTVEFARIVEANLKPGGAVMANIHFTPREPSLRYQKSLSTVFPNNYLSVGTAQGVGMYSREPISTHTLLEQDPAGWETHYRLPLRELLEGRHQESLEGVEPFHDD